jgi:diguanylate cyclase (GGDEF)-like protein
MQKAAALMNPAPCTAQAQTLVLVVDDDPAVLHLLDRQLSLAGYRVLAAGNGRQAVEIMLQEAPHIVITDWAMSEMNGVELCRRIRELGVRRFVHIIILTAHAERQRLLEAFEAGANDFVVKPVHPDELLARVRAGERIVQLEANLASQQLALHKANAELAILNDKLDQQAGQDDLTGLFNRRETLRRLHDYWATAERHDQPLSCVLIDIDNFKMINDTHGHAVGDTVLRHTVATISRVIRSGEPLGRVGGEEFLLICPMAALHEAGSAAERLRRTVAQTGFEHDGLRLQVTLSAGVAARNAPARSPEELLAQADQALYEAKRAGRNRVCAASPEVQTSCK